jgi:hypothetical protein
MKKSLLALALAIVAVGMGEQVANAAIQYDFRQTRHSQLESMPSVEFSGHAVIDGDRSRVEFLGGSTYSPGSYIITTNGARNMLFVDPAKRSYVEVNAGNVASAIGANNITVANFKAESKQLDDHPIVAAHKTDHWRLQTSYDITLTIGSIPIKQSVTTVIDKWVTGDFDDVTADYLAGGSIRTGNPDLDQLIDAETTKIPGFALHQRVQVTTTAGIDPHKAADGTSLNVQRTQTQTSEMTISAISKTAKVTPLTFTVPTTYRRADPLHDDTQKTPVHELDFKPAGSSN